jgi:dipeptidyl aminopeptidase/acylaminoacyl peptidase
MKNQCLLVLLGFAAGLCQAGRPIQLEDFYRIEGAATPAISPDGRWVVFGRSTIIEAQNAHHTELWIAPSDGSSPAVKLLAGEGASSAPRWSPDGKLLAFSRGGGRGGGGRGGRGGGGESEGGEWFLHMDPKSGEPFHIPGVSGAPIFSPDNKWIAFLKRTPPPSEKKELSPMEKTLAERFKGKSFDWVNYRSDGRGYLPDPRDPQATPPSELYIVARDGGTPTQLTHLGVNVSGVAWRPDSGALAFSADMHQRDETSYERADLWVVDVKGQIKRLTDDGFEYDSPAWSPDGKNLAFRRRQSLSTIIQTRQNHGAAVDIYRMAADGGAMKNLTPDFDLIPDAPRWQGDQIWFASAVGGDTHLFRMPQAGGKPVQVTKGERSFGGFSFSEAFDKMAYTEQDPTHPGEAFCSKIDASGETRLSDFNGKFESEVDLSTAQRIHFPSKDGTNVEGWIMLPHTGTAPHPMILSIHGGPHGAYGSHFDFEFQWLAAHGFAVLYTNPRGSTGYGEKFLWATWGGWGKLDYQDVMAGVDYAIAHAPVDPKRLAVTGYSYGGFMTDWVITQTPRFVAAVSGAGISNWMSDYGTSDIPRTKESEFYGTAWNPEASERMRGLSPITYASNVKTPTLFVHGEADMRVPIEQAEQMYRALRKQNVPAKMIRYPGNYHGGWPPWDMVHRYYNEALWFEQYLK